MRELPGGGPNPQRRAEGAVDGTGPIAPVASGAFHPGVTPLELPRFRGSEAARPGGPRRVVANRRRRQAPTTPSSSINRATRLRLTPRPCSASSAWGPLVNLLDTGRSTASVRSAARRRAPQPGVVPTGLGPARTSSIICCRNSGGYGAWRPSKAGERLRKSWFFQRTPKWG